MFTLAPIDRLILSTAEKQGGAATLQQCIDAPPPGFMPNAPTLGIGELLPRATLLRDLGCLEQLDGGRYSVTDTGHASLQHGVRIGGLSR